MSSLIAILSDTHNNLDNLNAALETLRNEGIQTIIHCGDLTSPETAYHFHGFRVIHVIGNGDELSGEIRRILLELNPENFSGSVFEGTIEGVRLAALHGHVPGSINELVAAKDFQYVFHGHTHKRRHEKVGDCTVINPGALGGLKRQSRSFAILDLQTGEITIKEVL